MQTTMQIFIFVFLNLLIGASMAIEGPSENLC
jgi:hypothetical protein